MNRALLSGIALLAALPLTSCEKAAPAGAAEGGAPEVRAVACLGRISPLNGIIRVAQPASSYPGLSPVAEVDVKEGDAVKKNQVLAVLENRTRLETSWRVAAAQALVARAEWDRAREVGPAEIAAQKAEVARLAAEFEAARTNQGRSDTLRKDSAIADVDYQATQLALDTQTNLLESARQRLKNLVAVDDADRKMSEAQYEAAAAGADHAKAELEQAFIRAPADGLVVRINAHPGETIGPDGAVEFAETNPLYVIAEVDESDASRVKIGEQASITGAALPGKLTGTVEYVGTKVGRNGVVTTDPAAASDSRVVEVKIRLDKSDDAVHFLQAKVTVVLQP